MRKWKWKSVNGYRTCKGSAECRGGVGGGEKGREEMRGAS